MAFPRAIINCLLETNVLTTPEKIEGAKWRGGIRRVEHERSDHAPGACQPQSVCFRPAEDCKGRSKLLQRTHECDVDRITRESIACDCVTGHPLALDNFETQANGTRENNIRGKSICDAQSQNPGQPSVCSFKHHKDDQPDTKNAQPKNRQALQDAYEQSHDPVVRQKSRSTVWRVPHSAARINSDAERHRTGQLRPAYMGHAVYTQDQDIITKSLPER